MLGRADAVEATRVKGGKKPGPKAREAVPIGPGTAPVPRQQQPLGLGHAVWCARHWIGREPFAVLLPDELMISTPTCTAQLVAAHEKTGGNVVAVMDVPPGETKSYGIVGPKGGAKDGLAPNTGIV